MSLDILLTTDAFLRLFYAAFHSRVSFYERSARNPFTGHYVSYFHSDLSKKITSLDVSPSRNMFRVHFLSLKAAHTLLHDCRTVCFHVSERKSNLFVPWIFLSYVYRAESTSRKNRQVTVISNNSKKLTIVSAQLCFHLPENVPIYVVHITI